jgi:phage/plasmid-associated DNA primase
VFDTNTYLFAFSNKVYDFKNNNFRNIEKDDYILTTTNRDWVEPTPEQIQTIKDIINNIFPDKEMQKTYISIMRSGLVGIRVDKFNVMSGGGREKITIVVCENYIMQELLNLPNQIMEQMKN